MSSSKKRRRATSEVQGRGRTIKKEKTKKSRDGKDKDKESKDITHIEDHLKPRKHKKDGKGKKRRSSSVLKGTKRRKKKERATIDPIIDMHEREYKEGTLYVTVERGASIGTNINKKSSFVIVEMSLSKQRYKTEIVKKTFDPIWNQEFEFILDKLKGSLSFKVFISERSKVYELGVVSMDLNNIEPDQQKDTWLNIEETLKKGKSVDPSMYVPPKIHVSFFYKGYDKQEQEETKSVQLFEDNYVLGEEIGDGGFSKVYATVKKDTNENFAVKIVDKTVDDEEIEVLRREIEIMKRLKHENIIYLEETFEDERYLYLVLELANGGELFDIIVEEEFLPEKQAVKIVKQILKAVSYLHVNGIAHRDLKPENILLINPGDATIKISDFGLSKDFDSDTLTTSCGTPDYVAPEVLLGMPYDNSVDIWSIAVIAYILLCGYPPFYGEDDQETFNKILRCEFSFPSPEWDVISNEAKQFISAVLVLNFNNRPSAVQCLRSPWIMKA